jgi:hypothetical protein
VAGWPDLEAGAQVAVASAAHCAFVDVDDLDLVTELLLQENLRDVHVDRRPGPGVFGQLDRGLRARWRPDPQRQHERRQQQHYASRSAARRGEAGWFIQTSLWTETTS